MDASWINLSSRNEVSLAADPFKRTEQCILPLHRQHVGAGFE